MNSQLSLASLFAVVVCVVSLPAIIQIEGREERGRHGAFGHSWLLKCLHACVARREEGGRERHFARGNCGSKAERKQVGMGADDEAWQASPFAWRERGTPILASSICCKTLIIQHL